MFLIMRTRHHIKQYWPGIEEETETERGQPRKCSSLVFSFFSVLGSEESTAMPRAVSL